MPRTISRNAQDLILRLLQKDPKQRLGGGPTGLEEIKAHPLFRVCLAENLAFFTHKH